jgi:hypothetical protein
MSGQKSEILEETRSPTSNVDAITLEMSGQKSMLKLYVPMKKFEIG